MTKQPITKCPECGSIFENKNYRRLFCSSEHKRDWNNRQTVRWAPVGIKIQAWRQGRNRKGTSDFKRYVFAEFCLAADKFNAEDKAAGRMAALDYLELRYRREGLFGL